ncbi:hypothetical protein LINPERHAP1_LOCUS16116 [Linum perenne]
MPLVRVLIRISLGVYSLPRWIEMSPGRSLRLWVLRLRKIWVVICVCRFCMAESNALPIIIFSPDWIISWLAGKLIIYRLWGGLLLLLLC